MSDPDLIQFELEPDSLDKCDLCNSENIQETIEGYVCGDCGVVLEVQKLEYHRPYDSINLQHAVLGDTQMGSKRERMCSPNSVRLEKLNRLDSLQKNKDDIEKRAKKEINRILSNLKLPTTEQELIFKKFMAIRSKLGRGTKYRGVEKLVPIVIYLYCKLNSKSIDREELLKQSEGNLSKTEFGNFMLQLYRFLPEYTERNRKDYVLQRILEITEHFELGMPFFYQSKKILYRLWPSIKNTKDDVIAGLCTSISALCLKGVDLKVSSICERLGIRMSTIHRQVEKNIFDRLQVSGFTTLVRSSDLLRKIMSKMGLILAESLGAEGPDSDIVEIKLGQALDVFNAHNHFKYYFYVINDCYNNPMVIYLRVNPFKYVDPVLNIPPTSPLLEDPLFEVQFWKFTLPKGPPISVLPR